MRFSAKTIDDILRQVLEDLLSQKGFLKATSGNFKERLGAHIVLKNPLARLSRSSSRGTFISCFAEAVWYLSGSDKLELIEHYIPTYRKYLDSQTADDSPGAYGPRLFSPSLEQCEVQRAILQLKKKPTSRQVVIQMFSNKDLDDRDAPCTCTLQFFIRNEKLHLVTYMRSNDAFKGLTHDVFAFTWIQEMFARSLGVGLGTYQHMVGSLHLYEEDLQSAQKYLDEGWLETSDEHASMPTMPKGEPWKSIGWLLKFEEQVRKGKLTSLSDEPVEDYWKDVARILSAQSHMKNLSRKSLREIVEIEKSMTSKFYGEFVRRKSTTAAKKLRTDLFNLHEVASND